MGLNQDFEELVFKLYKTNNNEIFSFDYQDKRYWLKKGRITKSNLFHKLFYKLFPLKILLPVKQKSSKQTIFFETNKIEEFRKLNINVPQLVLKNDNFFVLEDCGRTVNSCIREKGVSKEKAYFYIEEVLKQLSKIHILNHYHGGAQTRNFTYKDDKIFVIDFEDSFDEHTDMKILQFRDLVLFLLSLTKTRANFEIDYEYVIDRYIELVPSNNCFKSDLKKLANKLSFLIKVSQTKFINNVIGRDGRDFFKLFISFENLKG